VDLTGPQPLFPAVPDRAGAAVDVHLVLGSEPADDRRMVSASAAPPQDVVVDGLSVQRALVGGAEGQQRPTLLAFGRHHLGVDVVDHVPGQLRVREVTDLDGGDLVVVADADVQVFLVVIDLDVGGGTALRLPVVQEAMHGVLGDGLLTAEHSEGWSRPGRARVLLPGSTEVQRRLPVR